MISSEHNTSYQMAQSIVNQCLLREYVTSARNAGTNSNANKRLDAMVSVFSFHPIDVFSCEPGYASALESLEDVMASNIMHFISSTALRWAGDLGSDKSFPHVNLVSEAIEASVQGIKSSNIFPELYRELIVLDDANDLVAVTIYMICVAMSDMAELLTEKRNELSSSKRIS